MAPVWTLSLCRPWEQMSVEAAVVGKGRRRSETGTEHFGDRKMVRRKRTFHLSTDQGGEGLFKVDGR